MSCHYINSCIILFSDIQLLQDQIGVVRFEPLKEHFLSAYSQSRVVVEAIPLLPPLLGYPHRNWREAGAKGGLPATALRLSDLSNRLQVRIRGGSL